MRPGAIQCLKFNLHSKLLLDEIEARCGRERIDLTKKASRPMNRGCFWSLTNNKIKSFDKAAGDGVLRPKNDDLAKPQHSVPGWRKVERFMTSAWVASWWKRLALRPPVFALVLL